MTRLLNTLATLSFLLCCLLVALSISVHARLLDPHWTWITPRGDLYALSLRGLNRLGVGLTLSTIPQFRPPQPRWSTSPTPITDLINPPGQPYAFQGFPFFACQRYRPILPPQSGVPQPNWTVLVIPYHHLILASTLLPALRGVILFHRHNTRRLRLKQGLCPTCAYDLRASKDRCPECGTPIPPAS